MRLKPDVDFKNPVCVAYAHKEYAEGREPMPEYDWYCNHVFASCDAIPEEEAADWEKYERFYENYIRAGYD